MPDGYELLEEDHARIRHLFARFWEGPDDVVAARDVCRALTQHSELEERALYPLLRRYVDGGDDLADRAEEEHAAVKVLIERIEIAPPENIAEVVREMQALVEAHVTEEEQELFPEMRDSRVDGEDLGRRLDEAGRGQAA